MLPTSLMGTIDQYKINRLYCLLLICIKTSILFCVLKYLEAEHALERNTPAHNTSVVQNTLQRWQHTKRVRAATRQVCYVKILQHAKHVNFQHAKRVNLQHALLSSISTRQFGVRFLKTLCVLS